MSTVNMSGPFRDFMTYFGQNVGRFSDNLPLSKVRSRGDVIWDELSYVNRKIFIGFTDEPEKGKAAYCSGGSMPEAPKQEYARYGATLMIAAALVWLNLLGKAKSISVVVSSNGKSTAFWTEQGDFEDVHYQHGTPIDEATKAIQ